MFFSDFQIVVVSPVILSVGLYFVGLLSLVSTNVLLLDDQIVFVLLLCTFKFGTFPVPKQNQYIIFSFSPKQHTSQFS